MDAGNCAAYCFLDWEQFHTLYDDGIIAQQRKTAQQQYEKGLHSLLKEVHIDCFGVWNGPTRIGGHISAYEKLGYHVCTKDLLHGFLDSGLPVFVHRLEEHGIETYRIK